MAARPLNQQRHAMRAALYVRVSSEEQVTGYSLDAKVRAIEAHAAQHGLNSSPAIDMKARAHGQTT